jgi:two-component system, NarL family, invasion response regulator UvrY
MATLALVDDHTLLRSGLANLLRELGYKVLCEATNGNDFIEQLKTCPMPDVVLLDINMPVMDGYETALWLKKNHPEVKVLALSMYDDEYAIIKMLKNGARGYILKDADPAELRRAINAVLDKGFYHSDLVTGTLIHTINHDEDNTRPNISGLNAKEVDFLKLVCTEMTYKEIADKMCISPRTVDGYRDDLFEKLGVKSRVGLVLFAIKNGIVKM